MVHVCSFTCLLIYINTLNCMLAWVFFGFFCVPSFRSVGPLIFIDCRGYGRANMLTAVQIHFREDSKCTRTLFSLFALNPICLDPD